MEEITIAINHVAGFIYALNILERTGSTTLLKAFRRAIKSLAESNQLPDYAVSFNIENDNLIFTNRNYKQKTQSE